MPKNIPDSSGEDAKQVEDAITLYALYDQFSTHPIALYRDKHAADDAIANWYIAGRVFRVALPASLLHSDDLHIDRIDPR